MSFTLNVEERKAKLRDNELCMGVVYGPKTESISLQFNRKEFDSLYTKAGHSSLVTLEGLDKPIEVTIKDIQRAPFTSQTHHVDFLAIERGVAMEAEVPLVLVGEAPAEKLGNARVNQYLHAVQISCRPRDLVKEIEVDVSVLKELGDAIHVKDLNIPSTITINLEPEEMVLSVSQVQEEKKAEEIVPADEVPVVGEEPGEESVEEKLVVE